MIDVITCIKCGKVVFAVIGAKVTKAEVFCDDCYEDATEEEAMSKELESRSAT